MSLLQWLWRDASCEYERDNDGSSAEGEDHWKPSNGDDPPDHDHGDNNDDDAPSDGVGRDGSGRADGLTVASFSDLVRRIALWNARAVLPTRDEPFQQSRCRTTDPCQACLGEHSHEILQHIGATHVPLDQRHDRARAAATETISSTSRPRVAHSRIGYRPFRRDGCCSSNACPVPSLAEPGASTINSPVSRIDLDERRIRQPHAVRCEPPLQRLESPVQLGRKDDRSRGSHDGELAAARLDGPAVRRTPTGSARALADALTTPGPQKRHCDRYSAYERAAPFRPGSAVRDGASSSPGPPCHRPRGRPRPREYGSRARCRMRPNAHEHDRRFGSASEAIHTRRLRVSSHPLGGSIEEPRRRLRSSLGSSDRGCLIAPVRRSEPSADTAPADQPRSISSRSEFEDVGADDGERLAERLRSDPCDLLQRACGRRSRSRRGWPSD